VSTNRAAKASTAPLITQRTVRAPDERKVSGA
jgi:hypothetical protein